MSVAIASSASTSASTVGCVRTLFHRGGSVGFAGVTHRLARCLHVRSDLVRCILCEFYCTVFYIFLGTSINAQHILSRKEQSDWLGVSLGWGIALALALQMGSQISGPHVNPAVSFFFFCFGKITLLRFILYSITQTVGAFVGSVLTFLVYFDALNAFDGGTRQTEGPTATSGIFFPQPATHLGVFNGILDQVLSTAVLCVCIALATESRSGIPVVWQSSLCGLSMGMLGLALNLNAGYEMNPARDVGPKLLALCAGYGTQVFSYSDYKWFWIPIVCPFIGAALAALTYQLFIGFQLVDDHEKDDKQTPPLSQKKSIVLVEKHVQ